jgi:hypothetical protein
LNVGGEDVKARGKKALERVTSLCFRVLAMQKDQGSEFARGLRGTVTGAATVGSSAFTPDSLSSERQVPMNSAGVDSTSMIGGESGIDQPCYASTGGMARTHEDNSALDISLWGTAVGMQDLSADLEAWNFPEFWTFDLGGDF